MVNGLNCKSGILLAKNAFELLPLVCLFTFNKAKFASGNCIDQASEMGFIVSAYYRGAMGILLVYDVTDESSFNSIDHFTSDALFDIVLKLKNF